MSKVWDLFMYCGEDHLLTIRLAELKDVCDFHVIVESKYSHSGLYKGTKFNIDNFKEYKDKILYFTHDEIRYTQENIWFNEMSFRETLLQFADQNGLQPEDFVLHGDLDEITNSEFLKKALSEYNGQPVTFISDYFHFCLDLWSREDSPDCFLIKRKDIQNKMYDLRSLRTNFKGPHFKHIQKSAWHYSSVTSLENIIKKYHFYAHAPEVDPKMKEPEYLKDYIKSKSGGLQRLVELQFPNCPKYLEQNLDKYKQFLYSNYQ